MTTLTMSHRRADGVEVYVRQRYDERWIIGVQICPGGVIWWVDMAFSDPQSAMRTAEEMKCSFGKNIDELEVEREDRLDCIEARLDAHRRVMQKLQEELDALRGPK